MNWGGDENVAVEDWCALIGDLVGKAPVIQIDENAIPSLPLDVTRLNDLGFHSTVVVAGRHPPPGRDEPRRGVVARLGAPLRTRSAPGSP